MKCGDCLYWMALKHKTDWGYCELTRTNAGQGENVSLAYAQDYEDYSANLHTHKTFGCVQFVQVIPQE